MKAMIVDDELLARVGLHSLIDTEAFDITFIPDAENGLEAWNKILEERPDLMFLDLNIPELSGLDLLRRIRDHHIPITTIVVSCYEDFATVKEAMRLGATDYIRKYGLTREELTETLVKCMQSPQERSLMIDQAAIKTGEEVRSKLLHVPDSYRSGECISIYMLYRYAEEISNMKLIETIAMQFFQRSGSVPYMLPYENKFLLLHQESITMEQLEELHRLIASFVPYRCYMGLTHYHNIQDGDRFFIRIADSIETIGFYDSPDELLQIDQPLEMKHKYSFDIRAVTKEFDRGLSHGSFEEMASASRELFAAIRKERWIPANEVKKLFVELLSRLSFRARELDGRIEEIELNGSNKHYQKIIHMTSCEMIENWWLQLMDAYCQCFFIRQKRAVSDILQRTLDYIDEHLDKAIQLNEIAAHIGVSAPYLSYYFKREMNQNLIPYINMKKVERAKELFREGYLIYQISDMLGYEDATYFSKVFKKFEGVSPEQYKKTL